MSKKQLMVIVTFLAVFVSYYLYDKTQVALEIAETKIINLKSFNKSLEVSNAGLNNKTQKLPDAIIMGIGKAGKNYIFKFIIVN